MDTQIIGVRELQRDASKLVKEVEARRHEYRITVKGRETGVVLSAREPQPRRGATVEAAAASHLYADKEPAVLAAQLSQLEEGRDEAGTIGGSR